MNLDKLFYKLEIFHSRHPNVINRLKFDAFCRPFEPWYISSFNC